MKKIPEAFQTEDGSIFKTAEAASRYELEKKLGDMVKRDLLDVFGPVSIMYLEQGCVIASLLKFCDITIREGK